MFEVLESKDVNRLRSGSPRLLCSSAFTENETGGGRSHISQNFKTTCACFHTRFSAVQHLFARCALLLYCCVPLLCFFVIILGAGLALMNIYLPVGLAYFHQVRSNGSRSSSPRAADTNGHSHPDTHKQQSSPQDHPTSKWTWAGYLLLVAITKYTMPSELRTSNPTVQHVWFYGWVTALSTGAGAAPLILAHDMGKAMLAFGNAVAAGMMLSASYSLVAEGVTVVEPAGFTDGWWAGFGILLAAPWARMLLGVVAGLVFILSTKKVGGF